MNPLFERSLPIFGKAGIQILQNACVAVFGLGGVGSYTLEALVRAGISSFVLIDGDRIEPSNINRQLLATHSSVGMLKTDIAKKRILDISPSCKVQAYPQYILPKSDISVADIISATKPDFIVDTLDTMYAKIELVCMAKKYNIAHIAAMGFANRLDSNAVHITDISKTHTCPVARIMRQELKKRNIEQVTVAFSTEVPYKAKDTKNQALASVSWLPAVAGLRIAEHVIMSLLKKTYPTS